MKEQLKVGDNIIIYEQPEYWSSAGDYVMPPFKLEYPVTGKVIELIQCSCYRHITLLVNGTKYGFDEGYTNYRILKQETNINQSIV